MPDTRPVERRSSAAGPWRVHWYDSVTSTNDVARLFQTTGGEWHAVAASLQTAGRGQHGKRWESPAGANLLVTFSIPAKVAPPGGLCALAAGSAVCLALELMGVDARCKWPNDAYAGGAKICGILVDAADGVDHIGIGVNLAWPAKRTHAGGGGNAMTSVLAETGVTVCAAEALGMLARPLHAALASEPAGIVSAYAARCATLGATVAVRRGSVWTPAVATGIAADGGLIVRHASGRLGTVHSSTHLRQRT
ncbi:biotin--[acetyl-CoA-carboxylase] ligase [bacterium]|nr:biotin--[acetyl-CoA-carboxylase] ligase [bacterium]